MLVARTAAALALGFFVGTAAAQPAFDVCEAQVRSHATDQLGATITGIEFEWSSTPGPRESEEPSYAKVRVEQCEGFHLYELFATGETCMSLPHYGTPPDYLLYRGGIGGC